MHLAHGLRSAVQPPRAPELLRGPRILRRVVALQLGGDAAVEDDATLCRDQLLEPQVCGRPRSSLVRAVIAVSGGAAAPT